MTEGGIFQGDLLVATEHENEESKRQEKCVQHEAITVLPSNGRINALIAIRDFGEGQLCRAIVREAANPTILNGMVCARKWFHDVLTVHDPTPAVPAPVRLVRPVVDFIGVGVELAGVHLKILPLYGLDLVVTVWKSPVNMSELPT
jgi:hypothetical protein